MCYYENLIFLLSERNFRSDNLKENYVRLWNEMSTRYINVGRRNRQNENWATEDPMGRHVQESSRRTMVTNSQNPTSMEQINTTSVKATCLGTAHLVIKHSRSPWFHQEAVALMGLIRLI
jgi:hypothetical protein